MVAAPLLTNVTLISSIQPGVNNFKAVVNFVSAMKATSKEKHVWINSTMSYTERRLATKI